MWDILSLFFDGNKLDVPYSLKVALSSRLASCS